MGFFKRHPPVPPRPESAHAHIEIIRREGKAGAGYLKARETLLAIGTDAVPTLIEALEEDFALAQEIISDAPSDIDPREPGFPLEVISAASEAMPWAIVELLGDIADPRAVEPLTRIFNSPVKAGSHWALGKIHSSEPKAVLLGALEEGRTAWFGVQGFYFWKQGDADVVAALLAATDEAQPGLARDAIHSLVNLRATGAAERLSYLSSHATDDRLREKARGGLAALPSR